MVIDACGNQFPDLGVLSAAIATPYNEEGSVDLGKLRDLVRYYVDTGIEGIYCCGSSGEGLLLTDNERSAVIEASVEATAQKIPVVAHVGALSTGTAIELAKRASDVGATAISMIPPIYYTLSLDAVVAHYRAVMDATGLPLIIYNIPQFTGTEFDQNSIRELMDDPRIIGMKQTAHNMFALERIATEFPEKTIINGFDEVYLAATVAGAKGSIGTTVGLQIKLFKAIRSLLIQGDLASAMKIQSMVNEVIEKLVAIDVFPAAKYLSGLRSVGDLGPCRRPFLPLSDEDKARIRSLAARIDSFEREAAAMQNP